jgi:hypothetical protein
MCRDRSSAHTAGMSLRGRLALAPAKRTLGPHAAEHLAASLGLRSPKFQMVALVAVVAMTALALILGGPQNPGPPSVAHSSVLAAHSGVCANGCAKTLPAVTPTTAMPLDTTAPDPITNWCDFFQRCEPAAAQPPPGGPEPEGPQPPPSFASPPSPSEGP